MYRPADRGWLLLAFAYAAVVPVALSIGLLFTAATSNVLTQTREPAFLVGWVLVVGAGALAVTARATTSAKSVNIADLLPPMVAGVSLSFGGVQFAWGTDSTVGLVFGTLALGSVVTGSILGALVGRGTLSERDRPDIWRSAGLVAALAVATSVGGAAPYWLQHSPTAADAVRMLLLAACPVAGCVAVFRGESRLRTIVPLVMALPFLVPITGVVVGPLAVPFGLPPGTLLSVDPRAVALAVPVAVLVAVGAGLGAALAHVARSYR